MTCVELWAVTATGLKYSTMATPKVTIARDTQTRTEEETSHMRRTLEHNKVMLAMVQMEGEQFDVDESIALELYGLSTPKIKGIKKERIEEMRTKRDNGQLNSPLTFPTAGEDIDVNDENEVAYTTVGEYTKYTSNIGWDDIEDRF